ncbi:MAG: helix-turn-helix domain-containing protein [Defluviitaleaceae bacterium]|nr:helix-turn-helix domain-containing protein [Defluviitaleaceae bacterium]
MNRALTRKNKDRLDRTIGQNIRAEREMRKMSREELAEALDLTVSHMGLMERGERGATALTLEKLAYVFDLKIDSLFAEPDKKSLSVKEGGDEALANRKKIASLLTRLNEKETEFVVHVISGMISLHLTRDLSTHEGYKK